MKTVVVLGAGKIGRMVTHFLATCGDYQLRVADSDAGAVAAACQGLTSATGRTIRFDDVKALDTAMKDAFAVISCAPYHCNQRIAERARANGLHYLDLTEDVAATRQVIKLAEGARTAFIPQCGLAPGFITIVAADLIREMSSVTDLRLRVGALPRYPSNRLKYNLTWSTEGLINEYRNPCDVVLNGELRAVQPLENLERLTVDGVEYEAFNTSGGLGSLADTLKERVRNVNYKTIRYPGHNELIKFLFADLSMADHPDELKRIFERALPTTEQDQVVVFVSATGSLNGGLTERTYARTILHRAIDGRQWSAIQITTAAGVCAVLDLLAAEQLPQSGFVRQEDVDWGAFVTNRFGRCYA